MLDSIHRDGNGDGVRGGDGVTNEISIIPYAEVNGAWSLNDTTLEDCWRRMVDEGTARLVFWDGTVRDAAGFIAAMKRPSNLVVFGHDGEQLLGFAWLNGIARNHAHAHFCFFRASWGRASLRLGQAIVGYWESFDDADGGALFDVLVGETPDNLTKALKFIKRLGFERLGTIPLIARGNGMIISYRVMNHGQRQRRR